MKVLYLDCFTGISPKMLLGALLDLGLPEQYLRQEFQKLSIKDFSIHSERVIKCGTGTIYVDLQASLSDNCCSFADLFLIIDKSEFNDKIKEDIKKIYLLMAGATAKIKCVSIESVYNDKTDEDELFNVISIIIGINYLGIEKIYFSNLNVGSGFIDFGPYSLSVPMPLIAELLKGIPYYSSKVQGQLVTPTGAAIAAAFGAGFGLLPDNFISQAVGYGAASRDDSALDMVRVYLGQIAEDAEAVFLIEANIDDMNPQLYGYVMDKLFSYGALDAWMTPIIMKKNRPATKLAVLAKTNTFDKVVNILFTETTTIGIRFNKIDRRVAERKTLYIDLPWGQVRVKVSTYLGQVRNISPEYDDCRQLAEKFKIPLKTIRQEALLQASRTFNIGSGNNPSIL